MRSVSGSIPLERLWALYDYNPLTGQLWSKSSGRYITGSKQRNHLRVTLLWDGKRIHTNYGRVVFAWCTGAWPIHDVDHIDRDWTNNRIHNLRDADRRTNIQNRSVFTGATFNKRAQKWRSQIVVNGKQKHLGTFSSKAEAQAAYFAALSELVS